MTFLTSSPPFHQSLLLPPNLFISAFNNAWSIKLNALREKEQEMERTVRAAAAEDMAKWTQQREIRLKAKKEANRTEEQVFLESLRADPTGNLWEQVVKLIPGDSDADVKKSTNTGKMKSLFIQLKSDPVK
jgi:hypothetical protein